MDDRWAIVTGASGGLGTEFTRALARRGLRVLAVARSHEPLQRLADDVRGEGGTAEPLVADLAADAGVAAVTAKAATLGTIEMLVNNAGISTSGHFLEQAAETERDSIRVNVEALYALTRQILPGMVARGRGGILNVASVVAFGGVPYWTTYAATKAFVLAFGEGLAYELRRTGVRVVTVCPGFTKTGLYAESGVPGRAGKLLPHASPRRVVEVALEAYNRKRVVRVIGAPNRLLAIAGAAMPRAVRRRLLAAMFEPA